ncbi:MAG: transpeptidase family protein [Chitinophagaceae bacterium]|nr:transpeptidase family protein [Chitinophagaceae bacterium]
MEVKRDILWRVYLCFIGMALFGVAILGRVIYIQQFQGAYWRDQAKQQQQRFIEIDADRGTIYSEGGDMLSASIPFFDIYIDFAADGLREKNGKRFRENIDSLSISLAALFNDKNAAAYKKELQQQYQKNSRYYLLKKNISFEQYKTLRAFPLVRQGKNRSGFIAEVKNKRMTPFGLLANRTIGLSREYIDSDGKIKNSNVGLEHTYDEALKGESGKRLVRYIAGGVYVPVEGYEIEPEQGKDIVTTIDVNIQDIAENALLRMMEENEAAHGSCIVMEVKTGKIKAMANLGRRPDGSYWEDMNYAITASEPGSTFKLATMLALLEDKYITLNDQVNLEKGVWKVARRTVYDSERHMRTNVTAKQAFEYSSNVGMAKLTWSHYANNPDKFINHLKKLHFNELSGIDLAGETTPIVKNQKSKTWSATTLPWMSFGYEVLVSPLQTLMLYNAVANGGKMMKPYLVNEIKHSGIAIKQNSPQVVEARIGSEETIRQLQECLKGVCAEPGGTGYSLFKTAPYKAAGKTGTALVADGKRGYADHIYQSSFAGYFPADDPKYSCIVVIKNKPFAKKYYGGSVAGPVFKEIADRLYALNVDEDRNRPAYAIQPDSAAYRYAGAAADMKNILAALQMHYTDSSGKSEYNRMRNVNYRSVMESITVDKDQMPDVKGMGLKDALFLLENKNVKVIAKGRGKVSAQSVEAGAPLAKGQTVRVELN